MAYTRDEMNMHEYAMHIENADLTGWLFKDTDAPFAIIENAKLAGVDFSGANLSFLVIDDNTCLEGADFSNTLLFGAKTTQGEPIDCEWLGKKGVKNSQAITYIGSLFLINWHANGMPVDRIVHFQRAIEKMLVNLKQAKLNAADEQMKNLQPFATDDNIAQLTSMAKYLKARLPAELRTSLAAQSLLTQFGYFSQQVKQQMDMCEPTYESSTYCRYRLND